MISLRTHNILDYVVGVFLFLCPALFGFTGLDPARNTFYTAGGVLIVYSLLTDYRYSLARIIPLGLHMAFDIALGFVLMLAPSILDYRSQLTGGQNAIHFIVGLFAIGMVIFTRPRSVLTRGHATETPGFEDIGDRAA